MLDVCSGVCMCNTCTYKIDEYKIIINVINIYYKHNTYTYIKN